MTHFSERMPVVKRCISVFETLHYGNHQNAAQDTDTNTAISHQSHIQAPVVFQLNPVLSTSKFCCISHSLCTVDTKKKLMVSTRQSHSLEARMQVIPQTHMGSRVMPPLNLSLETRCVVSFMCPGFTSREKRTWHPLSRMGETQSQIFEKTKITGLAGN
jgi:hypothetical protein